MTSGDRYSLILWLSDCKHSVQARVAPWLQPVAEEGNLYAQFLYGEACKAGRYGVARDVARGAEYLERAAAHGHALSQYQLGMMHWTGQGVEQSDRKTGEYLRASAEAGLAVAQVALANTYKYWRKPGEPGRGAMQLSTDAEAKRWYERAARQGHAEAAMVLRTWDEELELSDDG